MDFTLNDGGRIPAIGLGTWPMGDDEAARVVAEAIGMGYRLVDTAFAYGNESGVGRGLADGLKAHGLDRDDIFVTTKFNKDSHSVVGVRDAWERSARKLGLEVIDLMLIHWPNPEHGRFVEAWEGLVGIHAEGKVRHIGVSNFLPEHLTPVIKATGVVPAVDQLQINPRYPQSDARAHNASLGIHTQAWSPLGQGTGLLEIAVFDQIAGKHSCTRGQVVLAWDLALGMSTIPKSSHPQRMAENLRAASITLDADDLAAIAAVDAPEPDVKHPNSFGH